MVCTLCNARQISYAATSRPKAPKPDTIPFEFDETDEHPDPKQFAALPGATSVVIVFPIRAKGASERLVKLSQQTHEGEKSGFILLGSSGIWEACPDCINCHSDAE